MKTAASLVLLLASSAVRADMGGLPGYVVRPVRLVFELAGDYSGYRFWLVPLGGDRNLEITSVSPSRFVSDRLSGSEAYNLYLFAASVKDLEKHGIVNDWRPTWAMGDGKRPPWLMAAMRFRAIGDVPFYDSRDEVVITYELEVVPGSHVHLNNLGRDREPLQARQVRYAVGLAFFGAFAAGGVWVIRRFRRRLRARIGRPSPSS